MASVRHGTLCRHEYQSIHPGPPRQGSRTDQMKLIAAAFLLVILGVGVTSISQAATFQLFKDEIEDLESLSVDNSQHVLYSIGPLELRAGTIVDIKFQAEVTNNFRPIVGIGRYVVRTFSPVSTSGVKVIKAAMSNVTPSEHHKVLVHAGAEEIREDVSGVYYNVVIYAIFPGYRNLESRNRKLRVERGYGELI